MRSIGEWSVPKVLLAGLVAGVSFNALMYLTKFGYERGNETEFFGFLVIGGVLGVALFYALHVNNKGKGR